MAGFSCASASINPVLIIIGTRFLNVNKNRTHIWSYSGFTSNRLSLRDCMSPTQHLHRLPEEAVFSVVANDHTKETSHEQNIPLPSEHEKNIPLPSDRQCWWKHQGFWHASACYYCKEMFKISYFVMEMREANHHYGGVPSSQGQSFDMQGCSLTKSDKQTLMANGNDFFAWDTQGCTQDT